MKVIELENETRSVTQLLGLARTEPLVFTRNRPAQSLLWLTSPPTETLALRTNAEFQAYLQQCRDRHEREGGVSLEEARARYALLPRAAVPRSRQAKPAKKGR